MHYLSNVGCRKNEASEKQNNKRKKSMEKEGKEEKTKRVRNEIAKEKQEEMMKEGSEGETRRTREERLRHTCWLMSETILMGTSNSLSLFSIPFSKSLVRQSLEWCSSSTATVSRISILMVGSAAGDTQIT